MATTIFSKIIRGDIPSYKITEDEHFFAFLDIMPVAQGHTLVVPKKEVDYLFDLEDTLLKKSMIFCKKVSIAMRKAIPCKRIGIAVIGLEVPHAHIHLVPLNRVGDINFDRPKMRMKEEELEKIATKIRSFL
jgi:histidine triad (HIT) family protein